MTILFLLLAGHAIADFPLQGDFLANGKNPRRPIPGVPWLWILFIHALIHAGAVYLVTGSLALAALELGAHMAIDYAKCVGRFGPAGERSFMIDQAAHVICKLLWICLLAAGVA